MSDFIETPTIGEILSEEFLIPLGISAYKLAQEINVPTSRIQDILHNRRKITVDTSLRLAKFFGLSDGYFMALQDSLNNFIADYVKTHNYDAILFKNAGAYFNPALDITKEVIDGLNARYKKVESKDKE